MCHSLTTSLSVYIHLCSPVHCCVADLLWICHSVTLFPIWVECCQQSKGQPTVDRIRMCSVHVRGGLGTDTLTWRGRNKLSTHNQQLLEPLSSTARLYKPSGGQVPLLVSVLTTRSLHCSRCSLRYTSILASEIH